MGYIFEELIRKFNEQANEEAGDHFTPREVIQLMVNLIFEEDQKELTKSGVYRTIYDPACGTGGMLSEAEKYLKEYNANIHLGLYGQEYNAESYAICCADLLIKDEPVDNIIYGDTLGVNHAKSKGNGFIPHDGLPENRFDYMFANPPFGVEWKNQESHIKNEYQTLGFNGRFGAGLPRINDGSLLFLQHMISKMKQPESYAGQGSRIAVVFNGSPLFTGDAGSGESNIRRYIIEHQGHHFEIDEFLGDNAPLILAELELPSETTAYPRPSWLGKEITSDGRYTNAYLSTHPYPTWQNPD